MKSTLKAFLTSPFVIRLTILISLLALSHFASAANISGLDKNLDGVSQSLGELIRGNIGKIVALIALLWTIIGCAFKFNVALIISFFGVLVLVVFGVSVVEGVFA